VPAFTCETCKSEFHLSETVLNRYPGWTPKTCSSCRKPANKSSKPSTKPQSQPNDPNTGVFTDGSSEPNPGPGGWGAVYVIDGEIIDEQWGHDPATTNNRMEFRALIAGIKMVPEGMPTTLYSDSNLCVQTVNTWAVGWEKRGWKRKTGEVQNLDLVKEAYSLAKSRPEVKIQWIKAHADFKWNEHADMLASRWNGRD
jgi:ribonuclease HI